MCEAATTCVIVTTGSSASREGGTGTGRPTVAVLLGVAVGEVVDLVCPGLPIPVVVHQLPQFLVPFLNSTCLEVFPQKSSRPEYAGVEPVQILAGAAGVKPAEFFRLWTIVVSGVFLNVNKFEQLDVLVDE